MLTKVTKDTQAIIIVIVIVLLTQQLADLYFVCLAVIAVFLK